MLVRLAPPGVEGVGGIADKGVVAPHLGAAGLCCCVPPDKGGARLGGRGQIPILPAEGHLLAGGADIAAVGVQRHGVGRRHRHEGEVQRHAAGVFAVVAAGGPAAKVAGDVSLCGGIIPELGGENAPV